MTTMNSRSEGENSDTLIIIKSDGDILIDEDVTVEDGLIVSFRYGVAFPWIPQTRMYKWTRADARPIPDWSAYIVNTEPDMPEDNDEFVNGIADGVYQSEKAQTNTKHIQRKKRESLLQVLGAGACVMVIFMGFVVMPWMNRPVAPIQVTQPSAVVLEYSDGHLNQGR